MRFGSENVPEILPYTAPGEVKETSKFPGVGIRECPCHEQEM